MRSTKPSSVQKYNTFMGAVDQSDAQIHPYDATRKTMNWTAKLGIHLMQRLLLNAYAMYRVETRCDLSFLDFSMKYISRLFDSTGKFAKL